MNTRNKSLQIVSLVFSYVLIMLGACFIGSPLFGAALQMFTGYLFTIVIARSKLHDLPVIGLGTLFGLSGTGAWIIALSWVILLGSGVSNGALAFLGSFFLFWSPYIVSLVIRVLRKGPSDGEKIALSIALYLCLVTGGVWLDRNRNTDTIGMNVDSRDLPVYRVSFEDTWKKAHPTAKDVTFCYYPSQGMTRICWVNYY